MITLKGPYCRSEQNSKICVGAKILRILMQKQISMGTGGDQDLENVCLLKYSILNGLGNEHMD